MNWRRWLPGWLAIAVVLSGCTGNTPASSRAPSTSPIPKTPATATAQPAVSLIDLLTAPVPSLCDHPAGQLVDGKLPVSDPTTGDVQIITKKSDLGAPPAFVDLNGDGAGDAAAVALCNAGGVNWPEHILLYSPGPTLIGDIDLATVFNDEHADVQTMKVQGHDVAVKWRTYSGAGSNFQYWSGRLHWNGNTIELVDTQPTG